MLLMTAAKNVSSFEAQVPLFPPETHFSLGLIKRIRTQRKPDL